MVSLPHLGSIKGQILKAIAVDSLYQWGEIRDSLGLNDEELRSPIKELKSEGLIEERYSRFRVEYNLWLQYKAHWGDNWAKRKLADIEEEQKRQEELMRILSERKRRENENYLRKRVQQWIEFKKFDVEPDTSHIYLKGDQLDSLLRDLIPLSKKEILVVNPYVEKSALCDLLIHGDRKGLDVQLITRSPARDNFTGKRQSDKFEYHKTLMESGVQLFYNNDVHAKLFILDKQVLAASSMNLYSESIAGKLWEAGIATTDPYNLKLAIDSYRLLLTDPYTKKLT